MQAGGGREGTKGQGLSGKVQEGGGLREDFHRPLTPCLCLPPPAEQVCPEANAALEPHRFAAVGLLPCSLDTTAVGKHTITFQVRMEERGGATREGG